MTHPPKLIFARSAAFAVLLAFPLGHAVALDFYEPFPGSPGEVPPAGWTQVNQDLAVPDPGSVESGSLEFAGLRQSEDNQFGIKFETTEMVRASWQSPKISGIDSGQIYYSFLLRVDDLGRLAEDGGHTGLIMLAESEAGVLVGGRSYAAVAIRKAGEAYQLGISSGHMGFLGGAVGADATLVTGEVVLVVVRFDYNSLRADLWVNPNPSANEPPPDAADEPARARLKEIDCIFLGGQTSVSVVPSLFSIDEIRVGSSWNEVVPPK